MEVTVAGVTDWLHGLLDESRTTEETQRAALSAVTTLAAPETTMQLLMSVRDTAQALSRRVELSYRHALGFDKLALIDGAPSFVLRLHVWWPEQHRGSEHVHDHRFVLASAILRGGYEMQVFRAESAGLPVTEYREQLSRPDADWQLSPLGPSHLRMLSSARLSAPCSYVLAADTLHRVIVLPDTLCLTLFLETAAVGSTTRVFTDAGVSAPMTMPKLTLSSSDYLRLLDAVSAAIAS